MVPLKLTLSLTFTIGDTVNYHEQNLALTNLLKQDKNLAHIIQQKAIHSHGILHGITHDDIQNKSKVTTYLLLNPYNMGHSRHRL